MTFTDEDLAEIAKDVERRIADKAPISIAALHRIAAYLGVAVVALGPRHDCKFVGGPWDGKIVEVRDCLANVPVCREGRPVGEYDRTGLTRFTFRTYDLGATRHDCFFSGGPRDGQINETPDETMTIIVQQGFYDRSSTRTFVFREPTPEPKTETWRDRAIREPMW